MLTISLTRGLVALVDDEDYDDLRRHKWRADLSSSFRTPHFYAIRWLPDRSRRVYMHRVVARTPDGMMTDHINGNTLDNQRAPCRIGFKGIVDLRPTEGTQAPRPWRAMIKVGGRHISIGRFLTAEEAAIAYDAVALAHFGEFAKTNASLGLFGGGAS